MDYRSSHFSSSCSHSLSLGSTVTCHSNAALESEWKAYVPQADLAVLEKSHSLRQRVIHGRRWQIAASNRCSKKVYQVQSRATRQITCLKLALATKRLWRWIGGALGQVDSVDCFSCLDKGVSGIRVAKQSWKETYGTYNRPIESHVGTSSSRLCQPPSVNKTTSALKAYKFHSNLNL